MTIDQHETERISRMKDDFLSGVSLLLEPSNSSGRSFLNYIQKLAKQFNVRNLEAKELIIEASLKGIDYIEKTREPIRNPKALLRTICLRILQDSVGSEKKDRNLRIKNSSDPSDEIDPYADAELLENRDKLRKALPHIPENDQDIINLRFYKDKSYKEIQQFFYERDGELIKLATLRKRESRALKKLGKFIV